MKTQIAKIGALATASYLKTMSFVEKHGRLLMFVFGVAILAGGMLDISEAQQAANGDRGFNEDYISFAVGNLFRLIEGSFGALIMVIAGIGAIVAAAMGAYKAAVGMLVVAVGAFILRSLVSLFFGGNFNAGSNASQYGGAQGV